MIKAVIYTRVSTEEQVHGYSLDNQKEACIKKAEELGVHDWSVFEEGGVSGEVEYRPEVINAIKVAHEDKNVKYFICYDPDRLSRDLALLLTFTRDIEKRNKVKLEYVNFQRDDSPEGEFQYQVRGAVAQLEKGLIKRRTGLGKAKKAILGGWTHWPGIFGYDFEKRKGIVTINEEEAKVVQLIFEYGAQMGIKSIADRLALMGILSPRKKSLIWSPTTIRRILDNETYYTGVTHIRTVDSSKTHMNKYIQNKEEKYKREARPKKDWIEMRLPPIIDEETFMSAHRKRVVSRRQSESNKPQRFLLSGLLRCGQCGKTWHGFSTMRQEERVTYYVCTYKSPGPPKGSGLPKCDTNFVPAREFEEFVWKMVLGWMETDDLVHDFNDTRKTNVTPADSNEIEFLRNRKKQLNEEENDLLTLLKAQKNARLRDKIQLDLDNIAEELDRIERLLEELESTEQETGATLDVGVIEDLREQFPHPDKLTWDQKYYAIHRLIESVEVTKIGSGYRLIIVPLR